MAVEEPGRYQPDQEMKAWNCSGVFLSRKHGRLGSGPEKVSDEPKRRVILPNRRPELVKTCKNTKGRGKTEKLFGIERDG